jgi:hypothetical protein
MSNCLSWVFQWAPESLKRVMGLVGLSKFSLDLDADLLDPVQSLREMNQVV